MRLRGAAAVWIPACDAVTHSVSFSFFKPVLQTFKLTISQMQRASLSCLVPLELRVINPLQLERKHMS